MAVDPEVPPLPSWPALSDPQHHRVWSGRMPQVWPKPTDRRSQAPVPATWTGVVLLPVAPLPRVAPPQHQAEPSVRVAHVLELREPASTLTQPVPAPVTGTGDRRSVVVPSPSWPALLPPQQRIVVSLRSAQPWVLPPVTRTQPTSVPTLTGDSVRPKPELPVPSWPEKPEPQHHREPSTRTAQLWKSPTPTVAQSVRVPTWTGRDESSVVPSPS